MQDNEAMRCGGKVVILVDILGSRSMQVSV